MRDEPRIIELLDATDSVVDGPGDDEIIIDLSAARRQAWGNDDSTDEIEPLGLRELLWSDVPVRPYHPRALHRPHGDRECLQHC